MKFIFKKISAKDHSFLSKILQKNIYFTLLASKVNKDFSQENHLFIFILKAISFKKIICKNLSCLLSLHKICKTLKSCL